MAEARRKELKSALHTAKSARQPLKAKLMSHMRYVSATLPRLQADTFRFRSLWDNLFLSVSEGMPLALAVGKEIWQSCAAPVPLTLMCPQPREVRPLPSAGSHCVAGLECDAGAWSIISSWHAMMI
jgi:hypothetical protein